MVFLSFYDTKTGTMWLGDFKHSIGKSDVQASF